MKSKSGLKYGLNLRDESDADRFRNYLQSLGIYAVSEDGIVETNVDPVRHYLEWRNGTQREGY